MGLKSFYNSLCVQTAVYWPLATANSGGLKYDEYGQVQYSDPYEVSCRWENKTEEFVASDATNAVSQSIVWLKTTETGITNGGVLMLGELSSVVNQSNPKANDGAFEIRRLDEIPDIKSASDFYKKAYL